MDGGGMHYFIYVDSWTVAGYVSMHHLCWLQSFSIFLILKMYFFKDKIPKIDFSSPAVEGEEGSADREQFHPERSPRPDQEAGRRWGQKGNWIYD